MKLSIGIVGLPNVGKSTLFKMLTGQDITIANYSFATIDPNVGVVPVPDERLGKLAKLSASEKTIPAVVEFYDIAGLVKGASKGEGLGNQFLARIREVSAICEVVRCFQDEGIVHVHGKIDPVGDIDVIGIELKLKDEESQEKENLLSIKPKIFLLNGKAKDIPSGLTAKLEAEGMPYIVADLGRGGDVSELVREAYRILGLISFFTTGPKETRAWTVKRGMKAPEAAGVIHSDFEQRFIRAEVVQWKDLLEAGGWAEARCRGILRLEGKDYVMQDGDVVVIRHG